MITLVETAGATNANTYASIAEADAFIESRLGAIDTWEEAEVEDKKAALVTATRLLDEFMDWDGTPADEDQALWFPTDGTYDRQGNEIANDEIQGWLKNAVSEFSFYLLTSDRLAETGTEGIKSMKAGDLAIEFDKYDRVETMPESVYQMIKFYGEKISSSFAKVVRT